MTRSLRRLTFLLTAAVLAACATPPDPAPDPVPETTPPISAVALPPSNAVALPPGSAPLALQPGHKAPPEQVAKLPPLEIPGAGAPAGEPPPQAADLLNHLRNGFSLSGVDNPEVRREIAWFARNPSYLDRVFERSRPYLPHVAGEVASRGLPAELAFLPVVESAFDPFAYSHGRAAGLWQIIPGTGRRFGLKQNWWYDGRRDVVESTRAALDYLEYLQGMFDGDWLLAVAAYNCGEGNVARAIRNNQAAGKPTDFWHLKLPAETRGYVPRLLGLAAFLADAESHGFELPEIPHEPAFATIELDGQIDLAIAAELAGIELAELQALNPAFNRWATDPDGPHRLQLPLDAAEPFSLALAELPVAQRMRWRRHEIRSGETLGGIARRYGTTAEVLRSANQLKGNTIRAGAHLMIPTSSRTAADYPLSASNRLAATQNRERAGRARSEYTVRSGDSLWSIAHRHGVGVRELAAWNGMAPGDTLAAGRKLVVWSPGGAVQQATASPPDASRIRRVHYTVRRGDSLYRIASNFSVTVEQIKRWNGLDGKRHLQPGQRLVLHVDVHAQSGS